MVLVKTFPVPGSTIRLDGYFRTAPQIDAAQDQGAPRFVFKVMPNEFNHYPFAK
jgi:hypothetical protein